MKQYFAPEFNIIALDVNDIITHSIATSEGDNIVDFDSWGDWGDESYFTPWGNGAF